MFYLFIIIIIIIIIISFMQGIYTYIPETNYVPSEHSVAATLLLLFMVLISLVLVLNLLYFYSSTYYYYYYYYLLSIRKNTLYKLMWWLYKLRHDNLYHHDAVRYSSSDVTSGVLQV